ncbi:hypothetical protein P4O66_004500, partial [Electrophorus voltai]
MSFDPLSCSRWPVSGRSVLRLRHLALFSGLQPDRLARCWQVAPLGRGSVT